MLKPVGIQLGTSSETFIAWLKNEIERQEAGQPLMLIADKLAALPDDMKPSPEEIEAVLSEFWEENAEIRRRYAKYKDAAPITLEEAQQHIVDLD